VNDRNNSILLERLKDEAEFFQISELRNILLVKSNDSRLSGSQTPVTTVIGTGVTTTRENNNNSYHSSHSNNSNNMNDNDIDDPFDYCEIPSYLAQSYLQSGKGWALVTGPPSRQSSRQHGEWYFCPVTHQESWLTTPRTTTSQSFHPFSCTSCGVAVPNSSHFRVVNSFIMIQRRKENKNNKNNKNNGDESGEMNGGEEEGKEEIKE
jgi:hypothetical protein